LGKGVTIRENIGRKSTRENMYGVIMGAKVRGKPLEIVKNRFVFGYKKLDVGMNHG
jgi:hypothetical protein